jgi:FkbM family methyltransferase
MFRDAMRRVLGFYPFLSGRPRLANSAWARRLVPPRAEEAWARVGTMRCRVPLNDWGGRSIFLFGDVDGKLSWIIDRVVEPGETVVDVGGNFGLVTLRLSARVGPTGAVVTFEPNPSVLHYLRQTLADLPETNVTLVEAALGAEPDTLVLSVSPRALGMASLVRVEADRATERHEVPVKVLADYLRTSQIQAIDFMKVDVEGFEANVFRGLFDDPSAPRPPMILFEANGPERDDILALVSDRGYRLYGIPDRCLFSVPFLAPGEAGFERCKDILAVNSHASERKLARIGLASKHEAA